MANMRDIRRRIRSVTNIQQITKAMKMVASARLQKAQSKAQGAMPFTTRLKEILGNLAGSEINYVHPLMVKPEKPTGKVAYLLITSDKGLAGAYSSNVIKELLPYVKDNPNADIFAVGRKGYEYFTRRNYSIKEKYLGFSERPSVDDARRITRDMSELFLSGTYDEIHIVFTQFFSAAHHVPRVTQLLPIEPTEKKVENTLSTTYEFEPSESEVLDWLVPVYMENMVFGALNQSAASELGARMTAMSSATDNAKELISSLTLHYNKVRQAGITREITEIVGGAEALQ